MTLVEADVHPLSLLGVQLGGRDAVLVGRDVLGEFADGDRTLRLAQVLQHQPPSLVLQHLEDDVQREVRRRLRFGLGGDGVRRLRLGVGVRTYRFFGLHLLTTVHLTSGSGVR